MELFFKILEIANFTLDPFRHNTVIYMQKTRADNCCPKFIAFATFKKRPNLLGDLFKCHP